MLCWYCSHIMTCWWDTIETDPGNMSYEWASTVTWSILSIYSRTRIFYIKYYILPLQGREFQMKLRFPWVTATEWLMYHAELTMKNTAVVSPKTCHKWLLSRWYIATFGLTDNLNPGSATQWGHHWQTAWKLCCWIEEVKSSLSCHYQRSHPTLVLTPSPPLAFPSTVTCLPSRLPLSSQPHPPIPHSTRITMATRRTRPTTPTGSGFMAPAGRSISLGRSCPPLNMWPTPP